MKYLITAVILTLCGCNNQAPKYHYFEYGCIFTLDNGCRAVSQTTVRVKGSLSFNQITSNISNWVAPNKITDIQIWYLKEVGSGEMYVYTQKFSCKDTVFAGIESSDTVKNTNNYITFKQLK